jgi:hypothetical protein
VLGHVEAGYIEAWVKYFARVGDGPVAESTRNTPIMLLGAQSRSFEQMYCYHSNENTDIKEAVFFGADDSFVLCASDSGAVAVYDEMAELLSYMEGDATIANCVRPHPRLPIIAWYVVGFPHPPNSRTHLLRTSHAPSHPRSMHAGALTTQLGYRWHRQDFLTIFGYDRSRHHRWGPAGRVLVRWNSLHRPSVYATSRCALSISPDLHARPFFRINDSERQRIADFGGLSFSLDINGEGFNVAQLIGMLMHDNEPEDLSDEGELDEDNDMSGDASDRSASANTLD